MKTSLKITLIYLILGIVWILTSDYLTLKWAIGQNGESITDYQTLKGIIYVSLTAILLYILIYRYTRKLDKKIEQLNEANRKLRLSNIELEQFAYVASHDLQEPLRMISSFMGQLKKKYGNLLDDKAHQYIHFAVDGAVRMRQLILDLLDYARVGFENAASEPVDLNELLGEIKLLNRAKMEEKRATIHASQLPTLNVQRMAIRQVFRNLISNALKYAKEEAPLHIFITAIEFEDQWQFCVEDNGKGIPARQVEKVFLLFHKLNDGTNHNDTGMSLSITKKIVEELGGKIWVESEEGKGSAFYFTIYK